MFGKIVQLRGIPLEDGFRVEYGMDFPYTCIADVRFATISLAGVGPNPAHYTYVFGYMVKEKHDGFITFLVQYAKEDMYSEKDVEDYLFVIIPNSAKIETTAKKIAGRYPEEAILEMHAGDTVKVNKGGADPETYMAVQAGNELFLIKKNR